MDDLFAYVDEHADDYIQSLRTLLRQPSVAAQDVGMAETAAMVERMLAGVGADARQIELGDGYPVIYGEIPGRFPRMLSFYNHYDVQPAEPLELWESDPWGAEVRDGRIWGTGRFRQQREHRRAGGGDRCLPTRQRDAPASGEVHHRGRGGDRLAAPLAVRRRSSRPLSGRRLHLGIRGGPIWTGDRSSTWD